MRNWILFAVFGAVGAGAADAQQIYFDESLARAYCEDEWTERGVLDSRMFNYCMERQVDGYHEALDLFNRYSNVEPVQLIDDIVLYALDRWATRREYQMNMVAYEIERQGEAYLNIAYEVNSGNVSQQALNNCTSQWLRPGEPEWSMVEYCLER